jgi:hypothetical protein
MNNPPATKAEKPIRFPKNKDVKRLEKQLASADGIKLVFFCCQMMR